MSAKGRTRCGEPVRHADILSAVLASPECNSTPRAGSKPKCWMATDNESRKRRRGPSDVRCDPCNRSACPNKSQAWQRL